MPVSVLIRPSNVIALALTLPYPRLGEKGLRFESLLSSAVVTSPQRIVVINSLYAALRIDFMHFRPFSFDACSKIELLN